MVKQFRTQNAMINALTGSSMQIFSVIIGFVSRTIFIYLLNSDYLGVNSLYTNILSVLSFAEFGIGTAIVFSLYKPISENNKYKIQSLMNFYRNAYYLISLVIFIAGICVIPFLRYIIKNPPNIKENLIVIYLLFLFNTCVSYLFIYKKTIITANQKEYIVQIYTNISQVIKMSVATLILYITHKYLLYLIIQIICTIALNVLLSKKADKMYPFIKEKNNNKLNKDERERIFENIKALFIYKFGSVVLNSTDNIIISSLINLTAVGLASNYIMLASSVSNIIGQAVNSLMASVGNLTVEGSKVQIKSVMNELLLMCVWLYGYLVIGFSTLANDFVYLWLGNKYILEWNVIIAILFSLYINGVQYAAYTFRTTQGLFKQSKYVPMITAILNIILSIWLGKTIGLVGIYFATGISRLLTTTIVDPWLIYKYNFNERPYKYYLKYIYEFIFVIINLLFHKWLFDKIIIREWHGFILKFLLVNISINLLFIMEFYKIPEFNNLKNRFCVIIKNVKNI